MMSDWMPIVLELTARVLAVLGLALLITTLMRSASASARHYVWTLAAAAVLLMPAVTLVVPAWRVLPAAKVVVTPLPAAAPMAPDLQATPAPAVFPAAEALPVSPAPVAAEAVQPSFDRSIVLPYVLLALWFAGACVLLLRIAVGVLRMRRIAAGAERVWSGPLHDALQSVARELGIARPVRLFVRADAMPITWGFIYPAVLLPEVSAHWTASRLETVLRHELAHVARADAFTQLLADVARALHWYNPLAWLMSARLRVEREHACDDLVLTHTGAPPTAYAEELLELARAYRVRDAGAYAAMAMARPSSLRVRLTAVLDAGRSRARVTAAGGWSSAVAAALVLLALAGLAPAKAIPVDERVTQDPVRAVKPPAPKPMQAQALPVVEASIGFEVGELAADAPQGTTCLGRRNEKVESINSNRNDDSYRLTYRTDSCEGDVRVNGKLTFNADFTRLTSIEAGGYVRLEEEYGRERRRLEIEPAGSGLARKWFVNGREQPYNAEAQAWEADMLLVLFRRLGFMASERAQSILRRQGVPGVLAEVKLIGSDHVQHTYLYVTLMQGGLDPAGVARVLKVAEDELQSDHYLATLLTQVAGKFQFSDATRDAFLAAARTLESDHYRHQVLTAALKEGGLTPAQVSTVVDQSATIGSDHYRAQVLSAVAGKYGMNAGVRTAYLRAARDMKSDHYRMEALTKLMDGEQLTADQLADVIAAAATIGSDHYLSQVLGRIEPADLKSPALQQAYLRAAESIESDHYLGTTLTRYVLAADAQTVQLPFVLRAARSIESDYQLAELLTRIANKYPLTGTTRDQFMEVLETIQSSHYYGEVSKAVLKKS